MTNATELAASMSKRGFSTTGILMHTPDGRCWAIDASSPNAIRLFELDLGGQCEAPQEHDAIDGTWTIDDITDYLRAVGSKRSN
jgi:hypothetical protein